MIEQVRPHDFPAWLHAVGQAHPLEAPVVLDVREPYELGWAQLPPSPGFRIVAIPMADVPERLTELDPDQPIACLCHHGMRSMQVARFLQGNGFGHVVNIHGGIDAWSTELDGAIARY